MRTRIRLYLATFTAAVMAAAVVSVPADASMHQGDTVIIAQTSQVTIIQDGDWILRSYAAAIPNSKRETISGSRIVSEDGSEGCRYHGGETRGPDYLSRDEVEISREVANRLKTCDLVMETGRVSADAASAFGADPNSLRGDSLSESLASGAFTTNAWTSQMYQKLYYEDPAFIDVTSVTVKLGWTWTGSCTTWSYHEADWGWYTPSGWTRDANWWGYDGANCQYGATTSNTGSYSNSPFCWPYPTTHNEYYTNYFQGYSNGAYYPEWDMANWGDCAGLLGFHRVIGFY